MVIYTQVQTLAGFTLPETLYLYGTTRLAFGVRPRRQRGRDAGHHDPARQLRPRTHPSGQHPAQVLADQFTPKRFGKLLAPTATLGWALTTLSVHWTALKVLVCVGTVVCGFVIYCAMWVLTGCVSFIAVDAREMANSFTYGSEFATEYPLTDLRPPARPRADLRAAGRLRHLAALALRARPRRSLRPARLPALRLAGRGARRVRRRRARLARLHPPLPFDRELRAMTTTLDRRTDHPRREADQDVHRASTRRPAAPGARPTSPPSTAST
jgi:hypothetical protein